MAWFVCLAAALVSVIASAAFWKVARTRQRSAGIKARTTIKHGPIPWPSPPILPAGQILQVYCEKIPHGKSAHIYALWAILSTGKPRKLIEVPEPEQARFIERQIEDHLWIEDVPVLGEHKPEAA